MIAEQYTWPQERKRAIVIILIDISEDGFSLSAYLLVGAEHNNLKSEGAYQRLSVTQRLEAYLV